MKKMRTTWVEWKAITKRIYLDRWRGWPDAEMREYYQSGMSPLDAYSRATARRTNKSHNAKIKAGGALPDQET